MTPKEAKKLYEARVKEARAEYAQAIKEARTTRSLASIAEELGVTRQRVQQISEGR